MEGGRERKGERGRKEGEGEQSRKRESMREEEME